MFKEFAQKTQKQTPSFIHKIGIDGATEGGAVLGSEARAVNEAEEIPPPGSTSLDKSLKRCTQVTGRMERNVSGKGGRLTNRLVSDGLAKRWPSEVRKLCLDLGMFQLDLTGIQRLKPVCWVREGSIEVTTRRSGEPISGDF